MKKGLIQLISFVLLMLFLIYTVKAQIEIPNPDEKIDAAKEKTEYLKQEWKNLLVNATFIGPVIKGADYTLSFLNPFFKTVLGVEYSLSWAFVFALILWLTLFFFLIPPSKVLINSKFLGIMISFIMTSLVGISGVFRKAVDILALFITNKWAFWLSLVITLIISFVIIKLGGWLKKILEREKEAREKERLKKDRETIHAEGEAAKKLLEANRESKKN